MQHNLECKDKFHLFFRIFSNMNLLEKKSFESVLVHDHINVENLRWSTQKSLLLFDGEGADQWMADWKQMTTNK